MSRRCWRKYIFGFSKSAPTPRYTTLDSRLPPSNAISEGRLPLSNTGSEVRALPLEVRIENDSDRKFSKSTFFHSFLETTFLHVSYLMLPCHCEPKIYFRFFKVCTSKAGALPLEVRIANDTDRILSKSKFAHSFL